MAFSKFWRPWIRNLSFLDSIEGGAQVRVQLLAQVGNVQNVAERREHATPRFGRALASDRSGREMSLRAAGLGLPAPPVSCDSPAPRARAVEGRTETDPKSLPPISYADKMIVSVMGAVFNILLAIVLSFILWIVGYMTAG